MVPYNTPQAIRPLEKMVCDFAYSNGYDPISVFNDFLRYVIHGFSPGAPPLMDWKYKRQQNRHFMEMLTGWIRLMQRELQSGGWFDAFGDLFMAISSKSGRQVNGQFFTPPDICDLMVLCTDSGETATGKRICDPTCGSGRLLLAYHVRHLGNYLVAEDVSRTCCLMTVCNMLVHGCIGEVIHHDSLCPENFMDGWMVNHTLTQTGIPSIRRMSEEEYRTSRNMSVDLLRKRKEKLRQMQPGKKQCKYSINSLVYWVTYVHNVVYSFYRSMIYCYINSTQRCAGSIVIDIIPTNGADKRKFFPFAPYFPVTNVIKRYFYPYFPAIIGIKGYSFPYFPYLSGIMKIKTALYSLFSRLDWHKTVVFPCLGEIYEGIRSLSWEIPVT